MTWMVYDRHFFGGDGVERGRSAAGRRRVPEALVTVRQLVRPDKQTKPYSYISIQMILLFQTSRNTFKAIKECIQDVTL